MDDSAASATPPFVPPRADGFPHQVHLIVPPRVVEQARRQPIVRDLLPTALGYFPRATDHHVERAAGTADYIVILCTAGEGWVEREGRRATISANDLVVLPPDEAHAYGSSRSPWTLYWAHFTGRSAADYAHLLADTPGTPVPIGGTAAAVVAAQILLRTLARGYGPIERLEASTGLAAWFGLLHRLRAEADTAAAPGARVLAAAQWLAARVAQRVSVAEMAQQAGLSESHFSVLFHRRLGYPPLDYHLRLKVQRACELFASTPLKVADVAEAVGFADALYFSRVFRRVMGTAPREYVRRCRNQSG